MLSDHGADIPVVRVTLPTRACLMSDVPIVGLAVPEGAGATTGGLGLASFPDLSQPLGLYDGIMVELTIAGLARQVLLMSFTRTRVVQVKF